MNQKWHSLLKRQLKKAAMDPETSSVSTQRLLEMINEAYHQFDTDRKMLERSLELSSRELMDANSQMRAVFQAFPDILLVVSPEGRIIDFKSSPQNSSLFHPQKLLHHHLNETDLPKLFPGLEAAFRLSLQQQKVAPLDTPDETGGEKKCFELRMESVETLGVIFIIRDTSAMKRIQRALAVERERLWVTIESISEGVITTNTQGLITLMNRHAEVISGLPSEQAIGRAIFDVLNVTLSDGPDFSAITEKIVRGESMDFSRYAPKLIRPDNRILDVFCSGSPIFDPQGTILGTVFILSDISQRRQLEEENLNMKKLESIGILAGGIAHDFNNILTGILGNISLARLYAQKGKPVEEKLKSAEQASIRAQELTQQFLTFSRGGKPVQRSESIVDLLEESAQFLLRGSSIVSRIKFDPALWQAHIDKGQITQVVNNLIINAKQAMQQGGVLTISARNIVISSAMKHPLKPGDYICITVKDQGIGIPRENLSRIFDPYFSTKPQGSGLGLTSSFHIVKGHGGLITVNSEPGKGSIFDVFLPASRKRSSSAAAVEEMQPGQGTVIVMDDDKGVIDVIEHQLVHLGYQVISVDNSQELVMLFSLAKETGIHFDLAILDLTIPGDISGEMALKQIREINPKIKAIVSSGYSDNPVMADYQDYGFNGKVGKPFRIADLAAEVKRVLTHCRL